jgi:hypothetical protein
MKFLGKKKKRSKTGGKPKFSLTDSSHNSALKDLDVAEFVGTSLEFT